MIMMGKSIRQIWVKNVQGRYCLDCVDKGFQIGLIKICGKLEILNFDK